MANDTILLIDDEEDILTLLNFHLEREGYKTSNLSSGERVVETVKKERPSLIVLDLMLPGKNGMDICRELSQDAETSEIPILMISAKNEDSDIILGLEMGADDYITKPFSPKIFLARVRAILRRIDKKTQKEKSDLIQIHDILIDKKKYAVSRSGQPIEMSRTEFDILCFLAENPGWVFSRNQIISAVKGDDYPVTERAVDVQILSIRKKLQESGEIIETIRGIGYRMKEEK